MYLIDEEKEKTVLTSKFSIWLLQITGKALAGDTFGEIGVLCYRPQPFTVRTTELSQILRLNITPLMNTIQANTEDGQIIMNNFFLVYKNYWVSL